eukprot:267842_1
MNSNYLYVISQRITTLIYNYHLVDIASLSSLASRHCVAIICTLSCTMNHKEYHSNIRMRNHPILPPIPLNIPSNYSHNDYDQFPPYHVYPIGPIPSPLSPQFNSSFVDVQYPVSPSPHSLINNVQIYDVNDMISENVSTNSHCSSENTELSLMNQPYFSASSLSAHSNTYDYNHHNNRLNTNQLSEFEHVPTIQHTLPPTNPSQTQQNDDTEDDAKPKRGKKTKKKKKKKSKKVQKMHVCKECDKEFKYKSHLERHLASHSKNKPFKCSICSKAFGHQYYLQDHIRYNHIKDGNKDRKHACDICKKTFRLKINLTNHVRIHSGEKPFKCKQCGKAFTQKGNCDAHYRACIGIKPFKCDVCAKTFTRKMYLQQHQRTHTGVKPFTCDVCSKAFAIKSNMVKHRKAKHKEC